MHASERDDEDVVALLLERHASVNLQDNVGIVLSLLLISSEQIDD